MVTARMIDQDPAHDLRGYAKKMGSALPVDPTLVDHAEIHLVNQRGRLQRVADSFHPKLARCDAAQLRVDEWQQLIKRNAVAATPTDRVWVVFHWDEQGWQSFVSDPEVPPIMKDAGHKSKPQAALFAGRCQA